jgi:hypothetical protein
VPILVSLFISCISNNNFARLTAYLILELWSELDDAENGELNVVVLTSASKPAVQPLVTQPL